MNSNQIKLFLHIGSPKTGTSSIQSFLNHNRQNLAKKYAILYPNFDSQNFTDGYMFNHAELFRGAYDETEYQACIKNFSKCIDFCHQNEIKKVVISSESWGWKWWPGLMKDIVDKTGMECKIIVYLRRQDKYLESAWKQWGHKEPDCETIIDYQKMLQLDWNKILNLWTPYFNVEQFIVRQYERSQIGDNIVEDFFMLMGENGISELNDEHSITSNANHGFGWDIIELLRYSKGLLSNEHDNKLISFMYEMMPESHIKKPMDDYAFLSPRQRLEIIDKYAASNREVARKFLNWQDMDLFNDPLPDPDEAWEPPSDLTLEKVIPIFMQIMLRQQQQIKDLKIQVNKIRRDS